MKFNHLSKYLAVLICTLFAFSQNVFAGAGDDIDNRANVEYQVSGVTQTVIESSATGNNIPGVGNGDTTTIVEDLLANFAIHYADAAEVEVFPGLVDSAQGTSNTYRLKYTVYNIGPDTSTITTSSTITGTQSIVGSNGGLRIQLNTPDNSANTTSPQNSLTDAFQISSCKIYDAAGAEITAGYVDVLPGASTDVYVGCDIPIDDTNGDALRNGLDQIANVYLHGQVTHGFEGTDTAMANAVTVNTGANTIDGMEFVLLDRDGEDVDTAENNGEDSDVNAFKIVTAELTATKTVAVVSDPVNGTTDPKAIPGAILTYTIVVGNSSTIAASNITLSDVIPDDLEYVAGSLAGVNSNGNAVTTDDSGAPTLTVTCDVLNDQ